MAQCSSVRCSRSKTLSLTYTFAIRNRAFIIVTLRRKGDFSPTLWCSLPKDTHTNTHAYSHSYSSEWRVKKTFSFTHSLRRHTNFSPSHQSFYFLSIHTYIRRYTRTHSSIELKAKMQFWQIHDGREGKSAWAWSSCYVTCGWCHLFRSGFLFLCIN